VMESPLPVEFARFLPALAASSAEHLFATDKSGKVPLEEAKEVIANAKDSFVVNGSSWSFVLPDDGSWEHMDNAKRTPGTELVKYEGKKSRRLVTMNLSYLPQVTQSVLDGVKALEIDQRTPSATMVLETGLTYDSVAQGHRIKEYGVLGGVVISVTPTPGDIKAGTDAMEIKWWITNKHKTWEPMQMDPRHIGTHDGNDMGIINHYHLILPPGKSLSSDDKQDIKQYMLNHGTLEPNTAKDKEKEKVRAEARKKKKEEKKKKQPSQSADDE
jgi:hypothetical protein